MKLSKKQIAVSLVLVLSISGAFATQMEMDTLENKWDEGVALLKKIAGGVVALIGAYGLIVSGAKIVNDNGGGNMGKHITTAIVCLILLAVAGALLQL